MIAWHKTHFLLSVAQLKQLPKEEGSEVAFIGRSNSGKSSALNAITHVKGLARTSKTPGRTQLINFFAIDDGRRLVDLPGYGYAKVTAETKQRWEKTLLSYLENRECLRGIILIMDIRHPLLEYDCFFLDWAAQLNKRIHILLTKADKLSNQQQRLALKKVENYFTNYSAEFSVQIFSALKGTGIDAARKVIAGWLALKD